MTSSEGRERQRFTIDLPDQEAALALAEMNFAYGDAEEAQRQAKRALGLLPPGSASALRAGDLEAVAGHEADERAKERSRR